jgi:hypothetical protein
MKRTQQQEQSATSWRIPLTYVVVTVVVVTADVGQPVSTVATIRVLAILNVFAPMPVGEFVSAPPAGYRPTRAPIST